MGLCYTKPKIISSRPKETSSKSDRKSHFSTLSSNRAEKENISIEYQEKTILKMKSENSSNENCTTSQETLNTINLKISQRTRNNSKFKKRRNLSNDTKLYRESTKNEFKYLYPKIYQKILFEDSIIHN